MTEDIDIAIAIENLIYAAENVCYLDWSSNDDDATNAIEGLRLAVKDLATLQRLRHETAVTDAPKPSNEGIKVALEVNDDMGRKLVAEWRGIFPGAGFPSLETAKQLLKAALTWK